MVTRGSVTPSDTVVIGPALVALSFREGEIDRAICNKKSEGSVRVRIRVNEHVFVCMYI